MDSEKCRALVTAVELGSMSAAAQQLGYTASGITRMINALEAELGITLIARTSRGVALTSDGVALEPFLRELALTAERARQQAAAAKGLLEGEISVASYSSTAATWLPNILRAFQSSHPGVRMRTMEAGNEQLVSWVEQHTIDCAIFAKRPFRGDRIPLRQDPLPAATPHTAWWKRGWASASTTSCWRKTGTAAWWNCRSTHRASWSWASPCPRLPTRRWQRKSS